MSKIRCVVTGGGGFLGKHIVQQLLDTGKYDVTVFDIAPCGIPGAVDVKGDLRSLESVKNALDGMEVVFHVATAAPTGENTLNKELMHSVNVTGTENVILACQQLGVKKIVYTSSASVVFQGQDLSGADETTPYASKPMDYYTITKIQGEQLILAANGKGGVATVALRPSGIFGEGDRVLVPTLVKQSKKGKMKFIIGNGKNRMDFTYAGNVAQAHLQVTHPLLRCCSRPCGGVPPSCLECPCA
jgi:sterol-4alpha-carboxylate 3-dehydrogenase (decarboxylating)